MNIMWNTDIPDRIHIDDTIHIWRFRLNVDDSVRNELSRILDSDELTRAHRFHFTMHRDRYIVARAQLRNILYHYTGESPATIAFSYNAFGKPFLTSNPNGIFFNLSHSHEMALVAVSRNHEIGIDIEFIRERQATFKIAKRFFSPAEVHDLMTLPPEQRVDGFFNAWTRKEAYIKGKGKGLAIPLSSFSVTLAPEAPATLLNDVNDPGAPGRWSFSALSVDENYAAAVAVCQPHHELVLWSV